MSPIWDNRMVTNIIRAHYLAVDLADTRVARNYLD